MLENVYFVDIFTGNNTRVGRTTGPHPELFKGAISHDRGEVDG